MRKILTSRIFVFALTTVTILMIGFTVYAVNYNKNSISHVYDESVNIPEPTNNKDVPSYAKWEPMLGAYISEDLYYDKESKSFRDKVKYDENYKDSEAYKREKWLEKNRQSSNVLYKSILEWDKSQSESLSFSAIRNIKNEPSFKNNILVLGYDYLPEMVQIVMNDNVWDEPMIAAIECMSGIECLPQGMLLDSAEFKHDIWKKTFKEYMANAKDMVKSKKDIEKLGMFALPFIEEEINNGNTSYTSYIPLILSKCEGESKENLSGQDVDYLKKWVAKNNKKITTLKSIIKLYSDK